MQSPETSGYTKEQWDSSVPWEQAARISRYSCRALARQLNVSLRQLERYTSSRHRKTTRAWLHDLRMRDAALLIHPSRQIKYIAILLGYHQVSHFSKHFKAYHLVPPSRFALPPPNREHAETFAANYVALIERTASFARQKPAPPAIVAIR
jgi:transcriptional regulator GlxA family with amidase domain